MPLRVERSAGDRFADVRRVASTGSTNTDLVELARAGAPEGVVLVADHQSAGRRLPPTSSAARRCRWPPSMPWRR
jgi:BirA family biotin operon repressor/biotin-[acetyl-CoA-carboxylase] ligase